MPGLVAIKDVVSFVQGVEVREKSTGKQYSSRVYHSGDRVYYSINNMFYDPIEYIQQFDEIKPAKKRC